MNFFKFYVSLAYLVITQVSFATYTFEYNKGTLSFSIRQIEEESAQFKITMKSYYKPEGTHDSLSGSEVMFILGAINEDEFITRGGRLSGFDRYEFEKTVYFIAPMWGRYAIQNPFKKDNKNYILTGDEFRLFMTSLKVKPSVFWSTWIISYLFPQVKGNHCGLYSARNLNHLLFSANEDQAYLCLSNYMYIQALLQIEKETIDGFMSVQINATNDFPLKSFLFQGVPTLACTGLLAWPSHETGPSLQSMGGPLLKVAGMFLLSKGAQHLFSLQLRKYLGLLPYQVYSRMETDFKKGGIYKSELISSSSFREVENLIRKELKSGRAVLALVNKEILLPPSVLTLLKSKVSRFNFMQYFLAHYVVILSQAYNEETEKVIYFILDTNGTIYQLEEHKLESLLRMSFIKKTLSRITQHPIDYFNVITVAYRGDWKVHLEFTCQSSILFFQSTFPDILSLEERAYAKFNDRDDKSNALTELELITNETQEKLQYLKNLSGYSSQVAYYKNYKDMLNLERQTYRNLRAQITGKEHPEAQIVRNFLRHTTQQELHLRSLYLKDTFSPFTFPPR